MKRLSHKNGERLEKRRICLCISFVWYSCVWLFFFYFSSFLGTLLDTLHLFVRFCFCGPPTFPHTENKTKEWTVSLFVFFFALTVFRKRTGGGGFLLPVHLPPLYMETTPGLFGNFFVPRGGARVATQMKLRKRGQRKCKGGNWVFFFSGAGAWAWGVKGVQVGVASPIYLVAFFFILIIFPGSGVHKTYPRTFFEDS